MPARTSGRRLVTEVFFSQSVPPPPRALNTERGWHGYMALTVPLSARWPRRILKSHDWQQRWCAVGCLHRGDVTARRRDLIKRLQRPLDEVHPRPIARRMRRNRLTLMVGGAIGLIPWIVYLGFTLPANYDAQNWPAVWMGFDCVLVAFMAATAVLGWMRRQLVVLPAFTTGILLICDAWFDVLTAGTGRNFVVPLLSGALGNLPLAVIMITGAVRILRVTALRLFFLDPGMPLWRVPLLP